MAADRILVRGAREHNLKNIDVELPRDQLVVITGVSGSGKSSLAFDTIYAEGQRRYVESLSAYARQFLGRMEKPDVDYIEGLSPAISIDQKTGSRNPRSTVGTVTEIYDYLRLLFARAGHPHCPICGDPIAQQTVQQIVDRIMAAPPGSRLLVLAPVVRDRKGEHAAVFDDARQRGFVRARVDGEIRSLDDEIALEKNKRHSIDVVVDRVALPYDDAGDDERQALAGRLGDSVEQALALGEGILRVRVLDEDDDRIYSEQLACPRDMFALSEIEPRSFSFNSPHGACPDCSGLGMTMEVDPGLVVPDTSKSVPDGAIAPWSKSAAHSGWHRRMLDAVFELYSEEIDTPFTDLPSDLKQAVLYGLQDPIVVDFVNHRGRQRRYETQFEGVVNNLQRRHKETDSEWSRTEIERYMAAVPCHACHGARLKPEALAVQVDGRSIVEITGMSVADARLWADAISGADSPLSDRERAIAGQVLKEIRERLIFLVDVGLDYLTLDRAAASLSGGEAQRIRLATQIGSSLMGVLYVCDEPSIGLHPLDDERLIRTLKRLRDLGNTVLIVEHDEATMRAADYIVDMGPAAGERGGEVVAVGPPDAIMAHDGSMTGDYLSGRRQIPIPAQRRTGSGERLAIVGATEHNLRDIDVEFPLGTFICVTGVSGSGKSTLVNDLLHAAAAHELHGARRRPGAMRGLEGIDAIDKVIDIDQSPIGRTPRSNPATYTGLFTPVRELFASVPEARMRGYKPGRFSFNVKGGRCEACKGDGYNTIEMQFLPDVTVPCEVCGGARYNREALEIRYKDCSIADVLNMTVDEAVELFDSHPTVRRKLSTLQAVGLGYIKLGQPATTLSGGEAQRVKLSTELSKRSTGRTLYLLDEPTTGLSFADVEALLGVLQQLVDGGNTVVVIEHHLDVIKNADWIVDLGPLGGNRGGQLIAAGAPEAVAAHADSHTGRFLREALAAHPPVRAADPPPPPAVEEPPSAAKNGAGGRSRSGKRRKSAGKAGKAGNRSGNRSGKARKAAKPAAAAAAGS